MTHNPYEPSRQVLTGHQRSWLPAVGYVLSVAVGAGGWLLLGVSRPNGEAWDNPLYFSLLVPAVALMAAGLGFVVPRWPWRWGIIPYLSQAIVAFGQNPKANLMPLGLIVFFFLAGLNVLPAYAGALLRRFAVWLRDRNAPPAA